MIAEVIGRPAAAPAERRIPSFIRRLRWPAAIAVAAIAVFCCALREARAETVSSDGASMVLQAWAMLHGNPLLHGWYLTDLSFITTELPVYMLVEAVHGIGPGVVPVCAAFTYTLLVLLAAFVARGQARGREGLARVAITVAIMVGPSLAAGATLLIDPDHTGTAVPVLLTLALIDRGGRRWWVPVAVAAVLGWAMVADQLVMMIGVAPLLLVCGARSVRLLVQRRVPLADAWYELSLTAAAVGAVAVSSVINHVIRALGGYTLNRGYDHFVLAGTMMKNVGGLIENYLVLFSADFFYERFGPGLVITGIHLTAAVLVVAAVVMGLRRFFRGDDLVAPLLATAIVVNIVAFMVIFQVTDSATREMAPVFGLGAALAGRLLAGPLLRNRLELLLIPGLAAALLAAAPPVLLAKPDLSQEGRLAAFLERQHLSQGVAGYWQANTVTVDSGGRVTMRSVRDLSKPGLVPSDWELDRALLNSQRYYADFLVATAPGTGGTWTVTEAEAIAKFGEPYRTYRFGHYVILVWQKNLLTDLA
jgi:hypothetical protein